MALKDLLPFRSAFKVVIICSAYETNSLLAYFDELVVSTMAIASHNKPAIIQYCPKLDGRVLTDMVELVLEIEKVEHEMHLALTPTALGHILVVLATANDVKLFCSQFEGRETALEVIPFHEDLDIDEQRKVFISSPRQKCIVSTELIKNSFYVDGVTYVVGTSIVFLLSSSFCALSSFNLHQHLILLQIDSGLFELKSFDPDARIEITSVETVFKKNADRRAARAPSGVCFRLYSEAVYDGLELQRSPELLRTSMALEILLLKTLDYRSMNDLGLLDPPGPAIVAAGFCELETL
jgi:HrpA-like RNA helicase